MVGVIFKALFQMNGLVNKFLGMILGKAVLIDWIGNASLALPTVMLLDLWVWTGFHMMLYIAGIQAISKEYYEAAIVMGQIYGSGSETLRFPCWLQPFA